jgi:hypothetical protein
MKLLAKTALGALMLAGATALTVAPADARVSFGIGIGGYGPGYYGGYYNAYCDPRSRWYDPYRCDNYDEDYYNGPVFIDGIWLNGGFRSRFHDGHREFFDHDRWRGGTGFHGEGFRHDGGGRDGGRGGGWGGHGGRRDH